MWHYPYLICEYCSLFEFEQSRRTDLCLGVFDMWFFVEDDRLSFEEHLDV